MTTALRSARLVLWPFVLMAVPFYLLYVFAAFVLRALARIVCAALGLVVTAVGVGLSLTIVGAVIGVPLTALGVLLMARALF